jgi:CBS domain-containing protein
MRMSSPAITVNVRTPNDEIERLLGTHGISSVPVVEDDVVVGIVSSTDLLASALGEARLASAIMSSPAIVAHPDEVLDAAAWRMVAARVHRIVVTETDQRVVGVLSARDILEEVMSRSIEDPISTVMRTPVLSIGIGDTIDEALAQLASANVHGLVVVDGMAPVGVFTHTEALASRRLAPGLRAGPVEEMMSDETLCLNVATPIRRAAACAVATNARRILAVQSRHLVGILSPIDLVGVLARAHAEG